MNDHDRACAYARHLAADTASGEVARRERESARDASVAIRARVNWFTQEYGDLLDPIQKAMLWSTVETFKGIEEGLQ